MGTILTLSQFHMMSLFPADIYDRGCLNLYPYEPMNPVSHFWSKYRNEMSDNKAKLCN